MWSMEKAKEQKEYLVVVSQAADQHLGQFNRLFLRGANHAPARGTGSELVPQNRRRARTPTTRGHYLCERAISRQKGISHAPPAMG